MRPQIAAAVLLVAFQFDAVKAFQTSAGYVGGGGNVPQNTKRAQVRHESRTRRMMVASPIKSEEESDLSSLVNGMLQSHRQKMDTEEILKTSSNLSGDIMPQVSADGVYRIHTKEQYENFLANYNDKLVVMKFSSPFCQACKVLMQKFRNHRRNPQFEDIVFGEITINKRDVAATRRKQQQQQNDDFFHFVTSQLKVTRIPYIHFYGTGGGSDQHQLVDSFACDVQDGCEWNLLKEKMTNFATMEHQQQQSSSSRSSSSSLKTTIKNRIFNFFSNKNDDLAP